MKNKSNLTMIDKWKEVFSKGKTGEKKKSSLVLVKKEPVTFQLTKKDNPIDFDRMTFVTNVCLKNDDKQYKTVLHIEQTRTGSRLVATDGQRLHVAEISKKIKSGDYKPRVTKDIISLGLPLEGVNYPSWVKVIPEQTQKRGIINLSESGMGKDNKQTEKLSIAFNSFVKQTGEPVNIRFLGDLTKQEWIVFSQGEKRRAILLREKTGKAGEPEEKKPLAVIMPIPQAA